MIKHDNNVTLVNTVLREIICYYYTEWSPVSKLSKWFYIIICYFSHWLLSEEVGSLIDFYWLNNYNTDAIH